MLCRDLGVDLGPEFQIIPSRFRDAEDVFDISLLLLNHPADAAIRRIINEAEGAQAA